MPKLKQYLYSQSALFKCAGDENPRLIIPMLYLLTCSLRNTTSLRLDSVSHHKIEPKMERIVLRSIASLDIHYSVYQEVRLMVLFYVTPAQCPVLRIISPGMPYGYGIVCSQLLFLDSSAEFSSFLVHFSN